MKLFYTLTFIVVISLLGTFYYTTQIVKANTERILQTQEVISKSDQVLLDILNIETSCRGFMITKDTLFLEPYNQAIKSYANNSVRLMSLNSNTSEQQKRITLLKKQLKNRLALANNIINRVKLDNLSKGEAIALIEKGRLATDSIKKTINSIKAEELNLLNSRKKDNRTGDQNSKILFLLLAFFIVIILVLISLIIRSQTRRNKELEAFSISDKIASQYSLSLIEASLDPLVTINKQGKITDLNEATVKITGIVREKLIGSDFFDYFTEQKKAREVYQEVFNKGSVTDAPLTITDNKGKLTHVLFNGSVYKDGADNVMGVVIVARDIAEQKWALDLRIANEELVYQNQEKEKRANELRIANEELVYQNQEKQNRAEELLIANEELVYQNQEKQNRADELVLANDELVYQNKIKEKRALELVLANKELIFQNQEKQNRASELLLAQEELEFQNKEKEKQRAEKKELEDNNNYLKAASKYSLSLIEASRDPLFTISENGIITDANQASVRATDVAKEKLIGSQFINYFTDPEKAKKGYQEVFEKGFVVDYPLTITDHKLTYVLFNGAVYKDENENVIGAVVVARDVSEQKKAEANLLQSLKEVTDYKLALDASTIVDITDKNGNIMFVNDNYIKISKYSYDELIGGNHQMVNSKFHSKEFMNTLWNEISGGKIWKNEIKNKSKEGNFYWLNMTIVPFLDEHGVPYQYVAISIDITAQKKLEAELIEARVYAELSTVIAEEAKILAEVATKKAEEGVKSKQQFLSNMSHEIRTPMNAIIGFTKVILKTDLSVKQKEYLTAIKLSGDSLIVLINDILDLAKVDAGKMTFEKTPFKLHLSITAMMHLFETKIQEKNLKLITDYDSRIPEVIIGDPVRLHQIILNLVSNAVKFTNKGSITVNIILLSQNQDTVSIKFEVIDTGIGIKENETEEIFENFQQATNETARIFGGTGLGLAIVKQLVEAQNGTIVVSSEVNKGSSFSFTLDFKKTNADAVLEPEILDLNDEIKDTKILVVEDMQLNQLLMKTLLDDFGFECDITANGQLAIEQLKQKEYDIILMDLQMPVMNGFEATKYIRETMKSQIPIIALTADVTTVDLEKCKAVGMNDYISKPVDERLLYSKLVGFMKKPILIIEQNPDDVKGQVKIKYVDMTYLNTLTKSNPELMADMINAYLSQTPPLVITMRESFLNKDWHVLQATIHKMLPSFSIMGISPDITSLALKIQDYATSLEQAHELKALVLELETFCNKACSELRIELTHLAKIK